ncbi:type VI secretion system contractile sheath large subunit [Bosea sp. (in: a-proteobacteria)]|uniref:type VI secretion system contractile sheath large subunit n=1 Tax=Bosea sp. (in: a-proteobacteria) TaxID=1871050 RepID=UPI003B3BD75C
MSTELQNAQSAVETTTQNLDEFSQVLKQSFRPRNEDAARAVDSAISTLVNQALADSTLIKGDVLDTLDEMIAQIDRKLTEQMNEIIHAAEFQQIESAWRGLNYLVMNSETDATLKIKVMNASKKELLDDLRLYPGARWDQSPLFKKVYEQEFGQLGGEPFGAIVADYYFSQAPLDVTLMRGLTKIAASAHAPLLTGAHPNLLGMDSWTELMNPRDLSKLFDTPDYAAWKSLRDAEDSRYLGLCMPRVLSRLPYGSKSDPVEEFAFEEDTDGHDGKNYGWMNAAYAMGVNVTRAFKEFGWCTRIRGVQSGGEVINLPVHTFPTDDGGIDLKCPTEIAITDRREAELSKSGLIPLIHRKNTDKAAFIGAQSVYLPKRKMDKATGRTEEATAADNLSARLPYIFAVSRFAHYLKCMVRDKVGSNLEKEQLERWLTNWLNLYIDGDPANSSESTKASRPLADGRVEVTPNEENPGYYNARFFLRPHYQLEGMDIGMSLVSRLPAPKS